MTTEFNIFGEFLVTLIYYEYFLLAFDSKVVAFKSSFISCFQLSNEEQQSETVVVLTS